MTFVLGENYKRSDSDVAVVVLPSGGGGRYGPASSVTAAAALRWIPYAEAISYARALLAASREDLRHRVHQLSRTLCGAFYDLEASEAPIAAGGARFPEAGLYVCVDLAPALLDVQRAMVGLSLKEAEHGSCDLYYDVVRDVLQLLIGDAGDGAAVCGSLVFDREKFESAFALEWSSNYLVGLRC